MSTFPYYFMDSIARFVIIILNNVKVSSGLLTKIEKFFLLSTCGGLLVMEQSQSAVPGSNSAPPKLVYTDMSVGLAFEGQQQRKN